jgi:hypothetical protein
MLPAAAKRNTGAFVISSCGRAVRTGVSRTTSDPKVLTIWAFLQCVPFPGKIAQEIVKALE